MTAQGERTEQSLAVGYINFQARHDGDVARTVSFGDEVMLDLDANDRALGVEVLGSNDLTAAVYRVVREARFQ